MKILIDNGHGINTPGKRSPDGELLEGIYNREIAQRITTRLQQQGIDAELLVPEDEDISLNDRCLRANKQSIFHGETNVLIISIHCNAASSDGKWHNARGWSVYTSKGQTEADKLADCLATAAYDNLPGEIVRADWSDGDIDIEESFFILSHTLSPAVLTEKPLHGHPATKNLPPLGRRQISNRATSHRRHHRIPAPTRYRCSLITFTQYSIPFNSPRIPALSSGEPSSSISFFSILRIRALIARIILSKYTSAFILIP